MKKLIIGLALVVLLAPILAALSCASQAPEPPMVFPGEEGIAPYPTAIPPPGEPSASSWWGGGADDKAQSTTVLVNIDERMIVRNGDISLVVDDVTQAMQAITQLAAGFNGYVVSSSVNGEEDDMRGWIAIRPLICSISWRTRERLS